MTPPTIARQVSVLCRNNRAEINRFLKFAVVGTIGATIDFSLLNLGIQVFGLAKWLANTISFSVAVLSNFTWNRYWTYPETRNDPIAPQLGQFLLVNVAGYLINQAIFLSLDHYVFAGWGVLGYNLAKAAAIGVVLFWNFGVNRIWTYRKVK
jgi:putative flippase GtrA